MKLKLEYLIAFEFVYHIIVIIITGSIVGRQEYRQKKSTNTRSGTNSEESNQTK